MRVVSRVPWGEGMGERDIRCSSTRLLCVVYAPWEVSSRNSGRLGAISAAAALVFFAAVQKSWG